MRENLSGERISRIPSKPPPPPSPKTFALIESLSAVFPGIEEGKIPFTIIELLLVTPRPEVWNECLPVFQRGGNTLQQAASLEDAAPIIRDTPPVLAILDLELEGKALRQAVIDIMMINASVHTAVVSDMDPDEFHEATEGLGILMPLPTSPKADDAERLLKALAGVM